MGATGKGKGNGRGTAGNSRKLMVAPLAGAVRSALTASAMALALGAGGTAMASDCTAPAELLASCTATLAFDQAPVHDLTTIPEAGLFPMVAAADMALVSQYGPGDVVIDNASPQAGLDPFDVSTIEGYSSGGNVDITNRATGTLDVTSTYGNAIGIYAYSATGNGAVDNSGDVTAYSVYGLADGIFVSGADVDVANAGALDVAGYSWATGIEAQGTGDTTVANTGDINVDTVEFLKVNDYYYNQVGYVQGAAGYGIYATAGGNLDVTNDGNISMTGGYLAGIVAEAGGDVVAVNNGSIVGGSYGTYLPWNGYYYYYGSQLAFGIDATSNGTGTTVTAINNGDINVSSLYGSIGVSATASGQGATANATNTGTIHAQTDKKYGYGAYGVVASADGDAYAGNSGIIDLTSGGGADGLTALSFTGDATAINSGDIHTYSNPFSYYGTVGIGTFAANGDAYVGNTGSVYVHSNKYIGRAVDAQGQYGVTVVNSGDLFSHSKYAYGVYAVSAAGDVNVTNEATGTVGFYSYIGSGFGILAVGQDDATVENAGIVGGDGYAHADGIFAMSLGGDAHVGNSGTVAVTTSGSVAYAITARADNGTASVDNSGDVLASVYGRSYYHTGKVAVAVSAYGAQAEVTNSGSITAIGSDYGVGISALGKYGANVSTSADSRIEARSQGYAHGIYAASAYGDVGVVNLGDIAVVTTEPPAPSGGYGYYGYGYGYYYATAGGGLGHGDGISAVSYQGNVSVGNGGTVQVDSFGDAVGIYGLSVMGNVDIANDGDVAASSDASGAYGILASGTAVDVSSSGHIAASGYGLAAGIVALSVDDVSVVTTGGSIDAYALGGGFGIFANSQYGTVTIDNASDIEAIGVYGGARALHAYGAGDVSVANGGNIAAASLGDAIGIYAYSATGNGAVDNSGDVTAYSVYGLADGIFVSGADVDVANAGALDVAGYSWATGIEAQGTGDTTVANTGDINVDTVEFLKVNDYYYNQVGYVQGAAGYGIYATAGGNLDVTNDGNISMTGGYLAGIVAEAGGDVVAVNNGSIVGGSYGTYLPWNGYYYYYGSQLAFGIDATSNGTGTTVTAINNGDINVSSLYGSIGVSATASGQGATANATNTGTIHAQTDKKYGYGAYGVVASADGDAYAGNSGIIDLTSGGGADGLTALSFTGDATAINSGDIHTYSNPFSYYGTVGIGTFAANGDAYVGNTGSVYVHSNKYIGRAVDAQGQYGVTVVNSGDLFSHSKYAYGVYAVSAAGDVNVTNEATGTVGFYSYIGSGFGILAVGQDDATVENAGIVGGDGYAHADGIFAMSLGGDAHVGNSGTVAVTTSGSVAYAITARADNGTASVDNSGDVLASVYGRSYYHTGKVAVAVSAYGAQAEVTNSGSITAIGSDYGVGISALGKYGANVSTSADSRIEARSQGYAHGIYAASAYGDVGVVNLGDIAVVTTEPPAPSGGYGYYGYGYGYYYATAGGGLGHGDGISAVSYQGNVSVGNGGTVQVDSFGDAVGIYGLSVMGNVDVTNLGDVAATSQYLATGIYAASFYGDVGIANAGSIDADAGYFGAYGIYAVGANAIAIDNRGDIHARSADGGYAAGISAYGLYNWYAPVDGSIDIVNTGDIRLEALYPHWGKAWGIAASLTRGDVAVANGGSIDIEAGGRAYGVFAQTKYGNASVANAGDINMVSAYDALTGIQAKTGRIYGGGDATVANSGSVSVHTDYGRATGIGAAAGGLPSPYGSIYGNASIANAGSVDVFGQFFATGIVARASDGDVMVVNSGDVGVSTGGTYSYYDPGLAMGIGGLTFVGGDVTVQNAGSIAVHGYADAIGMYGSSGGEGTATLTNVGDVAATTAAGLARGMYAMNYVGDAVVNNGGSVAASGGIASIGVHAVAPFADVMVNNAGAIHAAGGATTIGVLMENYYGTSTLNNSGAITVAGSVAADTWAVVGSDAVDVINNSGKIAGSILLHDGDDVVDNAAGGLLDVGAGTIEMGAGDDTLANAGLIRFDGGSISFGDSVNGNTFNNTGRIQVLGSGLIDMGTQGGASMLASTTAVATGFTNDGLIDMVDGTTGDMLAITGDLAGTGAINLDMSLATGTSDQLVIDGNVAADATQTVNIALQGLPTVGQAPIGFVTVSGNSAAGNFVAGRILGDSAANFLSLGVNVTSTIDTANARPDVFAIGVDVLGLDTAGSLAASLSSGAAAMLNSQVGTFRQRLGVNPYGDGDKVLSAFFRAYTDEGDVSAKHAATNFGQAGVFDFSQTSSGQEVGINANLAGHLHAGLTVGTADSRQRLTGAAGQTRMDGMTWGAYATWYVPQGFYVDLSGRWMATDMRMTSAGGQMDTRAHVSSTSLEAGYEWTFGNGFTLVPQAQYVRTEVEDVRPVIGDTVTFTADGGTSSRGRVGIEANRTFDAGNVRWTPYGSLNAVREFDGESTYMVGNGFTGSTSTRGTSAMAELGLGVQSNGWGATVGVNWTDGGAFNSFVGGQATVRFAW